MTKSTPNPEIPSPKSIHSTNSGAYNPGPIHESNLPTAELGDVQARILDLALEEFAEGPYGATTNEEKLGKVSEWKPGQAVSGRFRDSNMISNDRTVATVEEPHNPSDSNFDQQN
jgi:hypothetical protein